MWSLVTNWIENGWKILSEFPSKAIFKRIERSVSKKMETYCFLVIGSILLLVVEYPTKIHLI